MEYTIVNGELYHHGIKGQKWGVRRYQNEDGSLTAAGKKRYGSAEAFEAHQKLKQATKEYNQAFNKAYNHNHPYSLSKKRRQESQKRWDEAGDKAEQYRKAKSEYKNAVKDARKKAVSEYSKAFEKANKTQEIADSANLEMKEAYKNLGKTSVSRVISAFKGTIGKGNEAYDRYSKAYDRANKTQEIADTAYTKMRTEFQKTGKNYIDRVFNNIKYDPVGDAIRDRNKSNI